MILTPEQRQVIASGRPLRVEDPETHETYVMLTEAAYARIAATLQDGLEMAEVGDLVARAMAEQDAGDPLLDSYERYR